MKERNKKLHFQGRKAAVAIIVTAAMLIITGLAVAGEGMDGCMLAVAVLLSLGAGAFVLWPISYGIVISVIVSILIPFGAFTALENYTHVLTDLDIPIIILNLLFFYFLYGTTIFLSGSVKMGLTLGTLVPMIFGWQIIT